MPTVATMARNTLQSTKIQRRLGRRTGSASNLAGGPRWAWSSWCSTAWVCSLIVVLSAQVAPKPRFSGAVDGCGTLWIPSVVEDSEDAAGQAQRPQWRHCLHHD